MDTLPTQPKVSVMVVTYNFADIVHETINSVLNQDYQNLELVIADDASTDGTQTILKEYANRYPEKIKLILNPKNQGVTANCNVAFFACTGDLIAVMGGDDIFLPQKISSQVKVFSADSNVVLSYHPVEVFDSKTGKLMYITNQILSEDTPDVLAIIRQAGIPGASSVMVRRDACPKYGFDIRIPNVSDWKQQIDVALKGRVVKINRILGRYRKHATNVSNRKFELMNESLSVLDITLQENPDYPGLSEAVRIGKARYLAGEAYAQITLDSKRASDLLTQAIELDPKNRKLHLMSFVNRHTVPRFLAKRLLPKFRRFLKRWAF